MENNTLRTRIFGQQRVAEILVDLIPSHYFENPNTTFFDPAMGGGQYLAAIVKRCEKYHKREQILPRIYGVESSPMFIVRAKRYNELRGANLSLSFDWPKMNFDVVIGNPPYGNNGSLAVKFINEAAKHSDYILFVLPKSLNKTSRMNRVTADLQLTFNEDLPADTFPRGIGAIVQRWENTGVKREKIKTLTSHPDFTFTTREDSNHCICRCGAAVGRGFREYENRSENSHFMMKVANSRVIENLDAIQDELVKAGHEFSNGIPSLAKHDLISIYQKTYG